MLRRISILALVVLIALNVALVAAETEAEFKKMTIKQLKNWLNQRDISFHDISEKSEFVQRAVEWMARNKKVVREAPTSPFWEMWSKIAKDKCDAAVAAKSVSEGAKICEAIASSTESFFMMHGKRTANNLKKKPEALAKTSNGDIYFNAGQRIFGRLIGYCLNPKNRVSCTSGSYVTELLVKDTVKGTGFSQWITNVGIENTNPMYELINSKSHSDEL